MQKYGFYSYTHECMIYLHSNIDERKRKKGYIFSTPDAEHVIITEMIADATEELALEYLEKYRLRFRDGEFRGEICNYLSRC